MNDDNKPASGFLWRAEAGGRQLKRKNSAFRPYVYVYIYIYIQRACEYTLYATKHTSAK